MNANHHVSHLGLQLQIHMLYSDYSLHWQSRRLLSGVACQSVQLQFLSVAASTCYMSTCTDLLLYMWHSSATECNMQKVNQPRGALGSPRKLSCRSFPNGALWQRRLLQIALTISAKAAMTHTSFNLFRFLLCFLLRTSLLHYSDGKLPLRIRVDPPDMKERREEEQRIG